MRYRIGAAVAAIAMGAAITAGAGTAAAAPVEGEAATGWVVQTPDTDTTYETYQGTASVRLAGGATISCRVQHGWGRVEAGTLPARGIYAQPNVTVYGNCTGSPVAGLQIISSPGMRFTAATYDAAADRVSGPAYTGMWGMNLSAPGCAIDLYPQDPLAAVPSTYANRTATLGIGPFGVAVTRVEGAGCAGLAAVGDAATFQSSSVPSPGFTVRPA